MLTRILFLADVSPFSERALAWASEKLKGQQTDFLVLHVVDPAAGMEAPHVVREAEGYLEEMAARVLPPESYYKTLVLSGDILETLPETVRSEGCTFALLALPKGVDGLPLIRSIPVPQLVIRESEGLFPNARSIEESGRLEEERRLAYVGITRARQKLVLSYAESRRLHGQDMYGVPSRFLREIPAALLNEVRPRVQVSRPAFAPRPRRDWGHASLDQSPGLSPALRVACSPRECITFHGFGSYGHRFFAVDETTLDSATCPFRSEQVYLRVEVRDHQGRRAWTNPVFIDDLQ